MKAPLATPRFVTVDHEGDVRFWADEGKAEDWVKEFGGDWHPIPHNVADPDRDEAEWYGNVPDTDDSDTDLDKFAVEIGTAFSAEEE